MNLGLFSMNHHGSVHTVIWRICVIDCLCVCLFWPTSREGLEQFVPAVWGVCRDVSCLCPVPNGGRVGFNYCFCRPDCLWGLLHCLHKFTVISTVLRGDQLQVILITPEGKLFHLLSLCRLIHILNDSNECGADCKQKGSLRCSHSCRGRRT